MTSAPWPSTNPPQVAIAAGAAVLGKVSLVDSGGADATDTTAHASKATIVDHNGVALVTGSNSGGTSYPAGALVVQPIATQDGGTTRPQAAYGADAPGVNWLGAGSVLYNPTSTNGERQRTPTTYKTVLSAAGGQVALWTPAAGKKFRLMGIDIVITAEAAQAVAGAIALAINDGGTNIGITASAYVPAAAVAAPFGVIPLYRASLKNGYLSTTANNVLQAGVSAALTAGGFRYNVWGTEE